MTRKNIYSLTVPFLLAVWAMLPVKAEKVEKIAISSDFIQQDTTDTNEIDLVYPNEGESASQFDDTETPVQLEEPENIEEEIYYDVVTGNYYFIQRVGDSIIYRPADYMTFDEYMDYQMDQSIKDYWENKNSTNAEQNSTNGLAIPSIKVDNQAFDMIFGGNSIDIRPSGSAELTFGINSSKTENPNLSERQRRITNFNFDQSIQINLIGNIGDKLKMTTNYNTEATFDFENQIKVDYTGYEDEILQDIEVGNISFPLQTSLINGAQNLFGVKAQLRFGRLDATIVASQQRGQKKEINVKGGAQVREFELKADNYEANKHYFVSHFNRGGYEDALVAPPFINSAVNITKIEVWVTNTNMNTEDTRNIVAFQDLGENEVLYNAGGTGPVVTNGANHADNDANNLYELVDGNADVRNFITASQTLDALGFRARLDYQKVELARRLKPTEYSYDAQLGFISVNQQLQPNQVLAVAFQYTYRGKTYQVGEFSTDNNNGAEALYVKMLKSAELNTRIPMWDLMMKNIYALGAYNLERDGFEFNLWYLDRQQGIELNYLPNGPQSVNGKPLIEVLGLDKLDINQNPGPDGLFDFLDNPRITINRENGRIYFPYLEPFGSGLRKVYGNDPTVEEYAFDSLYTNTPKDAEVKYPDKNRFFIKGEYKSSSSSEIRLDAFNVPEGSVTVIAGGRELTENVDYSVDYTLGVVTILNQGLLESGTPIKVSVENNSMFNIQTKSLLAARFDYKVNRDLILGATVMNLTERPLTQKTNLGDEPMSNTMLGFDGAWNTESEWLTRMVDKIPGIDTKEISTVTASGEFATLIPGHNKAIGDAGTSYIDDFEGSQSSIDLRTFTYWKIGSIPQGQPSLFPEADLNDDIRTGYNRGKLAWYIIDPLFYNNDANTPDNVKDDVDMQSNHYMRSISLNEVFPNTQTANGQNQRISELNLAFYPAEKGMYNYNPDVDENGYLTDPQRSWGAIQRKVETQDFEAANVEFIQFWLMDPFNEDYEELAGAGQTDDDGYLYFHLGNVSEDVQKDGYKIYENGLPTDENEVTDLTQGTFSAWGRVTPSPQYINAFDNNPDLRQYQDVGLDGLRNQEEARFFEEYIQALGVIPPPYNPGAPTLGEDPSQDDFIYYKDDVWDAVGANVLERYKYWNGTDGNSPVQTNTGSNARSGSTLPDAEDINRDNTLDDIENYWQYRLKISRADLDTSNVGNNYMTSYQNASVQTANGENRNITWYQFKIPVREAGIPVGDIRDFRSIRFMRMVMSGFENPAVLRMAQLELVRGEWRKFDGRLDSPGDYILEEDNTRFEVGAVNIEENSSKKPVNYVLPPGIEREINAQSYNLQQLNEQSLSLLACNLEDGKAKAAYRNFQIDMRSYKKLKMYVHGESADNSFPVEDDELTVFVRLGTDFTDNYYEYEIPLKITPDRLYSNNSTTDRYLVWPEDNEIEVSFDDLLSAKTSRNRDMIDDPDISNQTRYATQVGKATVYVVGNPNLADLKTIMLGVRNPKKSINDPDDDGLSKCTEVWFNELRLTDFDESGGWASLGRVSAQLADLGTVSLSGAMSTPGWGQIEDKVSDRQRETVQEFDASINMDLGRFLGKESKLKVPMYAGFSESSVTPQFNPLSPDVLFDPYIEESYQNETQQDSVKRVSEARNIRRSLNFTNVRKEKSDPTKKARFYDISNFSVTYSYTEDVYRDFEIEKNNVKSQRAGLNYSYSGAPKNYKPFKNSSWASSKYLALIKDMNFYLLPKSFSYRGDMDRRYQERKIRNNYPSQVLPTQTYVNKTFNWNHAYDFRWDFTKTLKFDFRASNNAVIEEPDGIVNKDLYRDEYDHWKDSVWSNILNGGTALRYGQQANLTWNVPFNKLPLTDWITGSVRYSTTYNWMRASFAADSLGNTIENTQNIQTNASLNMTTLYNKIGYLKKVNQKAKGGNRRGGRSMDRGRNVNANTQSDDKKKDDGKMTFLDHTANFLMMLKSASGSYSVSQGILMPGYNGGTNFFGYDNGTGAPGAGFMFGQQNNWGNNYSFAEYAQSQGWLVQEEAVNRAWMQTYSENMNLRASIEPFKSFRIDVTANKQYTENYSQFYRWYDTLEYDDGSIAYNLFSPDPHQIMGSYNVSFNMFKTAFNDNDSDDPYYSAAFEQFSENRKVISERQSSANEYSNTAEGVDSAGYYDGYGGTNPDVLIPAFLAAYSGKSADNVDLNAFAKIPLPNWRLTYTGLSQVKALKKHFKSVTLSHAYRSTMSIGNFKSNVLFTDPNNQGYSSARDPLNEVQFVPEYEYQTVTLSEQFSPLINLDLTWTNSLITAFQIRKDRNIAMSVANAQVTEVRGTEYVIGLGYTFEKVKFPFQNPRKKKVLQSDLRTRADISIRDNITMLRKLDDTVRPNEATAGQKMFSLRFTADYTLNSRLNLNFYFDRIVNTPWVSNSFPTSNTNAGFKLRFTIS